MDIPNFTTKKELFDYLVTNKDKIVAARKAVMKQADGIPFISIAGHTVKAVTGISENENEVKVTAIINTTNVFDSHKDVHIPGIWKKSVKENRNIMHIQEHQLQFDKIIAEGDDLKVYTKEYTFKELGFNLEGTTEALVFESTVKRENNEFMFKRYKDKKVKNHSVGMHYVKLGLAVNDDNYPAEKALWDKYYDSIANKKDVDEAGYFWAVTEAKVIEGSAVPIGSNPITPTHETKDEPVETTHQTIEPPLGTQTIDFEKLSKSFKL
jgi:hypothetical protein